MGNFFVPTEGPETWRSLLAVRNKQGKDQYSTKELAVSWDAAKGFPKEVEYIFKESNIKLLENLTFIYGFPEYKVPLPGGSTSSQNDLYVLAKSNEELITIMVEGKVTDTFGPTLDAWKGDYPSNGKQERLTSLLSKLELDETSVLNKSYQLIHRTASAVIEAENIHAKNALVLVHSFSVKEKGYDAFAEFVKLFDITPSKNKVVGPYVLNKTNLYFGWVSTRGTIMA